MLAKSRVPSGEAETKYSVVEKSCERCLLSRSEVEDKGARDWLGRRRSGRSGYGGRGGHGGWTDYLAIASTQGEIQPAYGEDDGERRHRPDMTRPGPGV